jgi:hypothetical protein
MGFLQGVLGRPQQQPQQMQPQQQQQPVPQGQQHNPANNGNGSGGPAQGQMNNPANSQLQSSGNPANPLDNLQKLLTPSKEVLTREQQMQQQQNASLWGDVTPDKINTSVQGMDFLQGVNLQEHTTKFQAGDFSSLPDLLNAAVRAGMSSSIQMTQGMVEHGVRTGGERITSSLDSRVRDYQLRNQTSQNPALQHPVGKTMLQSLTKQIAKANPTMSPEEVQRLGEDNFVEFAEMILKPKQEAAQKASEPQGVDWTAWDSTDQN